MGTCEIDFARAGGQLGVRRHGLSLGGLDDMALPGRVVERVRALRPETLRFFVQEYFGMMPRVGEYRWGAIDAQLRSIAATGARPILALTMKPACLYARIDHAVTAPSDWGAWEAFITEMARHFRDELKLPGLWYEVGNEPDIGEAGGCPYLFRPADYAEYYDRTVRAVLRGDAQAKVGGPALALFMGDKEWTGTLAPELRRRGSPMDFFSWHTYNPVTDGLEAQHAANKRFLVSLGEPFASAVTVLDEWNISWVCNNQFGEFLQASFVADSVARMLDCPIDVSNYYHVMDLPLDLDKWRGWFSAEGLAKMDGLWNSAYRGLHMLTCEGEPAATYTVFQMLYEMEGQRVASDRISRGVGTLASRTDRTCRVLVWNYNYDEVRTEAATVRMVNVPDGAARHRHYRLGGQTLRDLACITAIRQGRMHCAEDKAVEVAGGRFEKEVKVEPYSVHLLTVEW